MKRKVALCLLAFLIFVSSLFPLSSQEATDIVVLMDTSGTILPWFDQIHSRVLPDITKKFIRQGDTFHLISFNSRVNLEIVQPVETEADISRIVSRFMLLYPLGRNSDFLSGLRYTWQYSSNLNQQRQKIVIVISDGIFNPPDSSPYASLTLQQVQEEVNQYARRIRGAGWQVYYVKLPFPDDVAIFSLDGNAITGQVTEESLQAAMASGIVSRPPENAYYDISDEFTEALGIQQTELSRDSDALLEFAELAFNLPKITFPQDLGNRARYFTLPLEVENASDYAIDMHLTGVLTEFGNILEKSVFLNLPAGRSSTLNAPLTLPENAEIPDGELFVELRFADNLRVNPQSATIKLTLVPVTVESFLRSNGFILTTALLIILALAILITAIVFVSRHTSKPVAEISKAAGAGKQRKDNFTKSNANQRQAVLAEYATKEQGLQAEYSREKAAGAGKQRKGNFAKSNANQRQALLAEYAAKEQGLQAEYSREKAAGTGKPLYVSDSEGKIMLNLYVERQNTRIGKRNVHQIKPGARLSIGGGNSSFLIFLVKFPENLAELRYDNGRCSLAILKPKFFPYEKSNLIEDCIERPVTIVSDKGYPVTFMVRQFEDPVIALNRLLNSINED